MKTTTEILNEAPTHPRLGFKVALVCSECPWWTNSWKKTRLESKNGLLLCTACGGRLKELPLKELTEGTQEDNPDHFDAFLKAFSDNHGQEATVQDP